MRDHRVLGRALGLFGTDPLFGAGLPYLLPDGAVVRHELEEFVRELQVADEAAAALALIRQAYAALGISPAYYRLSLPGAGGKYVGSAADWERSVAVLTDVLRQAGVEFVAREGEAAFYGPKVDVQFVDSGGREATLSTVQVDFHQPERFDLRYVGVDGAKHRAAMVHRSVIGSLERVLAHLVEQHDGAFPAWLAPTQVAVLPVSAGELPAAEDVVRRCVAGGLRVELARPEDGSLGARVRAARLVPYQVVVGAREAAGGAVAARLRDGRRDEVSVDAFLARVGAVVAERALGLWGGDV